MQVLPQSMEFTGRVSTMLHSSFLNRPKFVAVFVYGDYVYYLFQELDYALLDNTQTVSVILQCSQLKNHFL